MGFWNWLSGLLRPTLPPGWEEHEEARRLHARYLEQSPLGEVYIYPHRTSAEMQSAQQDATLQRAEALWKQARTKMEQAWAGIPDHAARVTFHPTFLEGMETFANELGRLYRTQYRLDEAKFELCQALRYCLGRRVNSDSIQEWADHFREMYVHYQGFTRGGYGPQFGDMVDFGWTPSDTKLIKASDYFYILADMMRLLGDTGAAQSCVKCSREIERHQGRHAELIKCRELEEAIERSAGQG